MRSADYKPLRSIGRGPEKAGVGGSIPPLPPFIINDLRDALESLRRSEAFLIFY
jgi:hypothetical protein